MWNSPPKKVFLLKIWKSEHHFQFWIFELVYYTKFQFKPTILIFWIKLAYSQSRADKMNTTIEFSVSLGTKFQLKLTILIFWTKFIQKDYFQLKIGKSKQLLNSAHLHCLGTKFQLKLTISIFSDQICPNTILPVKSRKKWTAPLNSAESNYFRCQIS